MADTTSTKIPQSTRIKIVFTGTYNTGAKTSVCDRYVRGEFTKCPAPTIGFGNYEKSTVVDGNAFLLEIVGLKPLFYFSTHTQRAQETARRLVKNRYGRRRKIYAAAAADV